MLELPRVLYGPPRVNRTGFHITSVSIAHVLRGRPVDIRVVWIENPVVIYAHCIVSHLTDGECQVSANLIAQSVVAQG